MPRMSKPKYDSQKHTHLIRGNETRTVCGIDTKALPFLNRATSLGDVSCPRCHEIVATKARGLPLTDALHQIIAIESESKLIVYVFSKDDIDGMTIDDTDAKFNLTDAQWELVRKKFNKADSHIREQMWELLEDIAREAKKELP